MISNRNLSILLLITGSVGISFGGLIMRNINNADPWQITFYRSLAFLFSITLVLIYRHNSDILTSIKKIGYPGIAAGFFLMIAQILYVQSFAHTSIANALFTFSTIPFISAFLAFIFLKEKISTTTIVTMFFAFIGIFIMIKDGLETGGFYGNIIALICAFSFSTFVIILRKSRNNDMLHVNLISSVLVLIVSYIQVLLYTWIDHKNNYHYTFQKTFHHNKYGKIGLIVCQSKILDHFPLNHGNHLKLITKTGIYNYNN